MFRWKRGVLHALIPFAAVVALGLIVIAVKDVADPTKFGEGLGRFAGVSLGAGFGISYLFQTGKRRAGWGVIVGFGLVIGAVALVLLTVDPEKVVIDRRALLDDGATLRHPSLHFSLKRPPAAFHDAPQLVQAMGAQDPDTMIYAYAPAAPSAGLIIAVMWGETDLAEAARGVKRGVDRSGVTWSADDIGADDAHLHATTQGVHLRIDMHRIPGAIVDLMVMSQDPDALADVISSFQR